jgi:hypothetical protein
VAEPERGCITLVDPNIEQRLRFAPHRGLDQGGGQRQVQPRLLCRSRGRIPDQLPQLRVELIEEVGVTPEQRGAVVLHGPNQLPQISDRQPRGPQLSDIEAVRLRGGVDHTVETTSARSGHDVDHHRGVTRPSQQVAPQH